MKKKQPTYQEKWAEIQVQKYHKRQARKKWWGDNFHWFIVAPALAVFAGAVIWMLICLGVECGIRWHPKKEVLKQLLEIESCKHGWVSIHEPLAPNRGPELVATNNYAIQPFYKFNNITNIMLTNIWFSNNWFQTYTNYSWP